MLSGSIPQTLGNLTALESLWLKHNKGLKCEYCCEQSISTGSTSTIFVRVYSGSGARICSGAKAVYVILRRTEKHSFIRSVREAHLNSALHANPYLLRPAVWWTPSKCMEYCLRTTASKSAASTNGLKADCRIRANILPHLLFPLCVAV